MVSTNVPTGVWLRVLIVSVELPEPAIELGLKVAVARFGSPEALNVTVPVNPFTAPTVTV
jgi:hypothetical protein